MAYSKLSYIALVFFIWTNGWSKSSYADGLLVWSLSRQKSKKDLHSFEILSGYLGEHFEFLIAFRITLESLPSSDHGGYELNISMTQQPKLHISAYIL